MLAFCLRVNHRGNPLCCHLNLWVQEARQQNPHHSWMVIHLIDSHPRFFLKACRNAKFRRQNISRAANFLHGGEIHHAAVPLRMGDSCRYLETGWWMGYREEDSHNLLFIYCRLTDRDEYEHDRVWRRGWGWFRTSWEQNSFLSLKLECSVITHQSEHRWEAKGLLVWLETWKL